MDVKAAVRAAKAYVLDLFDEEKIHELALEEAAFDNTSNTWEITLSFSRALNSADTSIFDAFRNRALKVVRISDSDEKVISVKNRELAA